MDFFSGAMGGNNDFIMNMIKDMAKGSGGGQPMYVSGGGGGPTYRYRGDRQRRLRL